MKTQGLHQAVVYNASGKNNCQTPTRNVMLPTLLSGGDVRLLYIFREKRTQCFHRGQAQLFLLFIVHALCVSQSIMKAFHIKCSMK